MSKRRYFVLVATGQPKQWSVYGGGGSETLTSRKAAIEFADERRAMYPEGSILVVSEVDYAEEEENYEKPKRSANTAKPAGTRTSNVPRNRTASANTSSTANTGSANTAS